MLRFRISVRVVVNVGQIIYAIVLAYMLLPSISQNFFSNGRPDERGGRMYLRLSASRGNRRRFLCLARAAQALH